MTLFLIGSLFSMTFFAFRIAKDLEFENLYFKFIFSLYMLYQFSIVVRGFQPNYQQVKDILQNNYIFWPSVIPLIVFINKDDLSIFYLIRSFYLLAIIFLIFCVADPFLITQRITAETYILSFVFTCGFLILNAKYLTKKITIVAFLSLLVGFFSFVYLARRNAIVSFAGLLFAGLYFHLRNMHAGKVIRLIPLIFGLISLAVISLDYLPSTLTERLNERLTEDSRSDVFTNFFRGTENSIFFGKGMNGKYYSPVDTQVTDDGLEYSEVQYRNVIENGYLQLYLTGGGVNIALFVLTLFPAAFLGIFKSKNQFSRACGAVILLWMIDMLIFGLPQVFLQYVLVWISVGICYKLSFRNKTDEEIFESFEAVGLV